MSNLVVGVDCGHTLSGQGTGSQGCGYKEQDLSRQVGNKVMTLLRAENCTVINCTVDKAINNNEQLAQRVRKANAQRLDIFVSIHFNACVDDEHGDGRTTGVECVVSHTGTKAYDEAVRVCSNISKLGLKNRGVKVNGKLYVTRETVAPAFLVEVCFIDDRDDINVYAKNVDNIAKAIVEGILNKSIDNKVQTPKKGFYRVVADSFQDRDNAIAHQEELRKKGINTFLVYEEI